MARIIFKFGVAVRTVAYGALALAGLLALLVLAYAVLPPVSTLMLGRLVVGKTYQRSYVRLRDISPTLVASVVASEDARFCQNDGVEWATLEKVVHEAGVRGPSRGASTITMQTAKNLFLWPGRSALRKGIEIPIALGLGLVWTKARTMEVYLNITEWGDGVFGIEAASQLYFHKSAKRLDAREAALLATSLPNPIKRNPANPRPFQRRLAEIIEARAAASPEGLGCLPR